MTYYHDTTVLGGLPVTVGFTVAGAEPDVGIMSSYIDDWWIEDVAGKPKKNTDWITNRMSRDDIDRLKEELAEAANEY